MPKKTAQSGQRPQQKTSLEHCGRNWSAPAPCRMTDDTRMENIRKIDDKTIVEEEERWQHHRRPLQKRRMQMRRWRVEEGGGLSPPSTSFLDCCRCWYLFWGNWKATNRTTAVNPSPSLPPSRKEQGWNPPPPPPPPPLLLSLWWLFIRAGACSACPAYHASHASPTTSFGAIVWLINQQIVGYECNQRGGRRSAPSFGLPERWEEEEVPSVVKSKIWKNPKFEKKRINFIIIQKKI